MHISTLESALKVLKNIDKELNKSIFIIHNGYKTDEYLQKIIKLQEFGFENSVIIFDSVKELGRLEKLKPNPKDSFINGVLNDMVCDHGAPSNPVH